MRWLDGIINLLHMRWSKFWEIVQDREAWHAAVQEITKSQTKLSNWTTKFFFYYLCGCDLSKETRLEAKVLAPDINFEHWKFIFKGSILKWMHNILLFKVQLQSQNLYTYTYIPWTYEKKYIYIHTHTLGHNLILMDSSGELKTGCMQPRLPQWESR